MLCTLISLYSKRSFQYFQCRTSTPTVIALHNVEIFGPQNHSFSSMVPSYESIFKDVIEKTRLGQDKELVYLIGQNQNTTSPLQQEVDQLIKDLNLVEFKVAQQVGHSIHDIVPEELSKNYKPLPSNDEGTQRRLSTEIKNLTQGESANRGAASTPAVATISNFSVNSRVTNLENQDYTPVPHKKPTKGSIKKTLKQYKAKLQHPELGNQSRTVSSQTVKASRRASLVGEVLPEYIRKQLTINDQEQNDRRSSSTNESLRKSPNRRERSESLTTPEEHSEMQSLSLRRLENSQNDRFRNVLVNSLSLYVRKDDNSVNVSQEGIESAVSDTDKEYILPSLFTRSVEGVDDHDGLLYHHTDDEDEDDEGNDEDEDDEDYLFKQ